MNISQESSKKGLIAHTSYAEVRKIHDCAWDVHWLSLERATVLAAEAYSLIENGANVLIYQGAEAGIGEIYEASQYDRADLLAENYAIQAVTAGRGHDYGLTGFLEASERLAKQAEASLTDAAAPIIRARVGFVKASILRNEFDYERSEAMFHFVLSLLPPVSEPSVESTNGPEARLRIDTLTSLARLQIFQGAFRQALETELRALDLARQASTIGSGYLHGEASALKNLAVIYQRLGNFVEATAALHRILDLTETLGDYFDKTNGFIGLANMSMLIDEPTAALNYLNSALQLSRDHNFVSAEAIALGNIGTVYQMFGEMDLAIEHFETAVSTQQKINYRRGEAANLYGLGCALEAQGRFVEARHEVQAALAIHRKLGDRHGIATCLISLGRLSLGKGADAASQTSAQASSFRKYLDEAFDIIASTGSQDLLADVHEAFSTGYKAMGDFSSALYHFELFHLYKGKMAEAHAANHTQTLLFKRELEQNRKDAEIQRLHAAQLQDALEEARTQRALAERLANEDILTGLPNRRHGEQLLAYALEAAQTNGESLSLVFADADHFKNINDLHSHMTGDRVLRQLAEICKEHCRPQDIAVRYGGEEFLCILPATEQPNAARWAEELRVRVAQFDWPDLQSGLSVTLSLGVAAWSSTDGPILISALISSADKHLYEAKKAGRNRVRP